jgi:hypothetical protein
VGQLPKATVRAVLGQDQEIPAALAWARRRGLELTFDELAFVLTLPLCGALPASGSQPPERFLITGSLDDYDVLPPIWRYVEPRTGELIGPPAYPTAGSVFHSNGLVCAPWSRLA